VRLVIGSVICYLWALTIAKEWAERKMSENRVLQAIQLAVQTEALKLIVLCHISPILPATVLHYVFATMGYASELSLGSNLLE